MTAPQIIAVVVLAAATAVQVYGLVMTDAKVRRIYGNGGMARRMLLRTGWPHAVNVAGMGLWAVLLAWGGFWS